MFAVRRYGERDDILCVPKRDQAGDVDAEIREPSRAINLQITGARDPSEHLRVEYFVNHPFVSLTGNVTAQASQAARRERHGLITVGPFGHLSESTGTMPAL
jgi:hypothetical protein